MVYPNFGQFPFHLIFPLDICFGMVSFSVWCTEMAKGKLLNSVFIWPLSWEAFDFSTTTYEKSGISKTFLRKIFVPPDFWFSFPGRVESPQTSAGLGYGLLLARHMHILKCPIRMQKKKKHHVILSALFSRANNSPHIVLSFVCLMHLPSQRLSFGFGLCPSGHTQS